MGGFGANGEPLEAAVLDMDGVVTRTARLHRVAWKELFDEFLAERANGSVEERRPFSPDDYRAHVDGRPRYEGIRAFLASRGIELPEGRGDESPSMETVRGLGLRKNQRFRALVDREGVEVDRGAVAFVRALRTAGVRVGIATSSENGALILERAGLGDLFDAHVDGVVSKELGLRGKPEPDIFIECARRLGASAPSRVLVVEDAASGVAAARAGDFGLVIGVGRSRHAKRLREAGADWIVRSLGDVSLEDLRRHWSDERKTR